MAHSYNILGHINGVEIVKTSNLYFKTILNILTPASPKLADSLKLRIGREVEATFPQDPERWSTIIPLEKIVHCISSAFSMITVGAPLCNDPEHIHLMSEQASLGLSSTPNKSTHNTKEVVQSSRLWLHAICTVCTSTSARLVSSSQVEADKKHEKIGRFHRA